MDWVQSRIRFEAREPYSFDLVHFDCVDSPIVAGAVYNGSNNALAKCEEFLGSVLWLDAVSLFIPYVVNDLKAYRKTFTNALCLGEGTGAVGCGLATVDKLFKQIHITDLPALLPLLELNASLASPTRVTALSLDWMDDLPEKLRDSCDVVIGCEVLYGNRFVWDNLLAKIHDAVDKRIGLVYVCVTLRNERHDLDDFKNLYLRRIFAELSEIPLSDTVSVLKASVLL
jgi:hypothetical protein